jgi:CO/xanthine dehydrogenase Mo-binding subunit/aerobic-type carbon monoxide dehydrogenase small subunit (CoxS/CutS family)
MNRPVESAVVTTAQTVVVQVNGIERCLPADLAARRLSDVLRGDLGLTGTKVGCSAGDCGACTVLLDDRQVCACLVPLAQCAGRSVRTVESLAQPDGRLSELQQAFVDHGAAQCGICTPGMLMAAADVLERHPEPIEQQVLDGLGGVLCRCTGYRKIVEAVLAVGARHAAAARGAAVGSADAAEDLAASGSSQGFSSGGVAIEAVASGQAVGARVVRFDARAKVTGAERYGADEVPVDALHLRVIRSTHARATFEFGDLAAWVAAHPGIVGVVTAADINRNRFAIFPDLRDQPALAEGEVRILGEAVLVLAGEACAVEAVDPATLPIRWQPLAPVSGIDAALAAGAPAVQARWPDNILCRGRVCKGDVDALATSAARVLEGRMLTRHIEHAYIEPEAGYARWEDGGADGAQVTVFACTQTPYMDRDEIAWMFDLAPERVRIIPSAVGGGFGGKLDMSVQPLLVAAARKFGRPARLVYDRPESMRSTTKRHPAQMRARLVADRDGRFVGYDFQGDFNTGAYSSWGPTVANRVPIHACGPYRFEAVRALTRAVITNDPIAGAFRGFGVPQSTLLGEMLIDELAEAVGEDPLELRHRNALRAGDRTATGQLLSASVGMRACLDALRPAWQAARARLSPSSVAGSGGAAKGTAAQAVSDVSPLRYSASDPHGTRPAALRRGLGIACMWYGIGNTVIANPSRMEIGLLPTGRFIVYNGAVDIGQGTYTIVPQIAADAIGVPLSLLDQTISDTALTLDAGKSSASRQTFVSGNAARFAGEALRARLLALLGLAEPARIWLEGSVLCGAPAGDQGGLGSRTSASGAAGATRRVALDAMPRDERGHVALAQGRFDPPTVPLDADGQGVPYATYGFAAQFAEVEVDVELGTVRVVAIHAAHDVGRAINPTQVEGQIHGGIAQGLGLALMEEYHAGRTDNLHDYLIPTVGDMPPITVHLIEDPEPLGPSGAKGVGEPALIATAPAILAAIRHATGVRLHEVPVTPDRLLAALREGARS